MVQVNLNSAGYLRDFSALPAADAAPMPNPVDTGAVFRSTGLDLATFAETDPKFVPLGAADEVHSWKGPHSKIPNLDLTVEIASWKGRVTTVHVLNNWKGDTPDAVATSVTSQIRGIVLPMIAASGVLAAILLARRNWKLGRIDRKGALRIGIARFLLGMVIWLGTVHAVPSSDMISLALASLAAWLAWGAGFWLLYLALEPSVRAHWPHSLVTWNRILVGRWKDAQVGSHILIGATVGAAVWTTAGLLDYFTGTELGGFSGLDAAAGTRQWIAFHASTMAGALMVGLVIFFSLTGLRQLVKKDPIAATLAAMFFTFSNSGNITSSNWTVKIAIYLFVFAALLLVLLRYGLVTIIAAAFFIDTMDSVGLGLDWKTWYAPAGLATVALLAGIAVYAFWRSLGSRELIDEAAG
jgi:serine/threonine-protein kinase